jgi:hypothetical protein
MIVHDFDVMRTIVFLSKTDPPLVVDPGTVLSGSVSRQLFQSISGLARLSDDFPTQGEEFQLSPNEALNFAAATFTNLRVEPIGPPLFN